MQEVDEARQSFDESIAGTYPRNRFFILAFEFAWGLGISLGMLFTVVPSYMTVIGAPKSLIGFVVSSWTILSPLQLVAGHFLAGRYKHRWLPLGYTISVIPWFLYSMISFLVPNGMSDGPRLVLFTFVILWFAAFVTMSDATYISLTIDAAPLKKRGSLFGLRLIFLAAATFLSSFVARWVMDRVPEPRNYHLSFTIATVIYAAGSLTMLAIKEHIPHHRSERTVRTGFHGLVERIRTLMQTVLGNPNYRITIFFFIVLFAARELNVFVVTFARDHLGISGSQVVVFTVMRIFLAAIFAVGVGKIADKKGYKLVTLIMAAGFAVAFGIVAYASKQEKPSIILLYLGYGLHTGAGSLSIMALANMSAEIVEKQDTTILIALGNILVLPVLLFSQPLSGLLVDITGSYFTLFVLGFLLSLIGAGGFLFLVQEPRGRRMYAFRFPRRIR